MSLYWGDSRRQNNRGTQHGAKSSFAFADRSKEIND